MKKDRRRLNPASKPSGDGCVECLASPKGWWVHLLRCAQCGHVGCSDSSASQHASKHAAATGHPIITSFEPVSPLAPAPMSQESETTDGVMVQAGCYGGL